MDSETRDLKDLLSKETDEKAEADHLMDLLGRRSVIGGADAPAFLSRLSALSEKLHDPACKAWALHYESDHCRYKGDMKRSADLNRKALIMFDGMGDKKGLAACYRNEGLVYASQGEFGEALQNHLKGLRISEELNDKKAVSASLNNIGNVYMNLSDYAEAMSYYLQSKRIKEELNDKSSLSAEYNNIGSILLVQKNYSAALENFNEALKIALEISDKHSCAICYTNIGQMYLEESSQPETAESQKVRLLDMATENFNQALSCGIETQQKNVLAICYANIGNVHYTKANYPRTPAAERDLLMQQALTGHAAALGLWQEIGDKAIVAHARQNIGNILMECRRFDDALKELHAALQLAEETKHMQVLKDTLSDLTGVHKALGDHEKALQYHERYTAVMGQIQSEQQQRRITLLSFQHNMDLKDKNARILDEKNKEIEIYVRKLERSNEELRQFAHVAAHDLRAPLRLISSYLDILREDLGPAASELQIQCISAAVSGSKRMADLIHALLELARIDVTPQIEMIKVDGVLEEVRLNLQTMIKERNVQVVSAALPAIRADRVQLLQLFQNIISNGIKYNESPVPVIDIQCRQTDTSVLISIADNGMGIKPEYRAVAFQIFRRLHSGGDIEGTGIGLAICKKIVDSMGGTITIEDNPTGGSVFVITLPILLSLPVASEKV